MLDGETVSGVGHLNPRGSNMTWTNISARLQDYLSPKTARYPIWISGEDPTQGMIDKSSVLVVIYGLVRMN